MMNFYHQRKNVNLYKEMMKDYDTGNVLDLVKQVLPKHLTILQLSMGTGTDLLKLSEYYQVIGSDFSPIFFEDFQREHPEIKVYKLDASDFSLNQKFDCIYLNKVLYHLSVADFKKSLRIQAKHLNKNGIIFMTMWYETHREEFYEDDLRFVYYTYNERNFIMVINKTTLTIQDAQYLLGSSAYSIYKLIHEGKLYAYKDAGGKMWKIPEQAILDYLNSLKVIYPQR